MAVEPRPAEITPTQKSSRHSDLDRLKGLAILLVVIGHIVSRDPPADAAWYETMKAAIYLFHMPLFMFLCGLVAGITEKPVSTLADYRQYAGKKIFRLMPAYALFSVLVFAGKFIGGRILHVDNPVRSPLEYFQVLLDPHDSYCAYLWFIQVLLAFYLLLPIANRLTGQRLSWLLPICLLGQWPDLPSWFAFSSLAEYSFVFVAGVLAGRNYGAYSNAVDRLGHFAVAPFVVLLCFGVAWDVPKFLLGVLSIPACHAIVRLRWTDRGGILRMLGLFTFPIYLMNTLCIGVTKGVLLRFTTWDGIHFYWFGLLLLAAGTIGPILVKRWLLSRSSWLDRIVA